MNTLTQILLMECKNAGYTYIGIGQRSEHIPCSLDFPIHFDDHSIFAHPDIKDSAGWPAIWGIVDKLPILRGLCGNGHQKQIGNIELLTCGVYNLNELFLDNSILSSKRLFQKAWHRYRPLPEGVCY